MKSGVLIHVHRFLLAMSMLPLVMVSSENNAYSKESWKDITEEVNGLLGNSMHKKILQEYSPLFVNTSSVKQISSVNHKGRVFRRADFSYYNYGQSHRKRIVVDCSDWFYKENDSDHYWSWVPPSEYVSVANNGLEYITVKYLCAGSEEPWKPFVEAADGTKYFYNRGLYSARSDWYGEVRYVYVTDGGTSLSSSLKAYASCPKKLFALYPWVNDPGAKYVDMDSVNPLSVGEAMLDRMCGFPTRARESAPSINNSSTIRSNETQRLIDRYQKAQEQQEEMLRGLMRR